MDLPVDRARQDQPAGKVLHRRCARRRAVADPRDLAVAHRDMAALDHALGEHDVANQDEIEIRHGARISQRLIRRKRILEAPILQ